VAVHSGRPKKNNLHTRRYPWKEWFATTEPFTIYPGRDFNGRGYTMAQQIRNNASARRYAMEVRVVVNEDESVTVTVLGKRKR